MDEEKVIKTINELLDCVEGKSFGENELVCILSTFLHTVIEATAFDISRLYGRVILATGAIEYKKNMEGGVEDGDNREQEG